MAKRPSYRDRALVIRTYDFGEADRVVVLLTKEHGLVRSVAKGVRRANSRFGSRLQPFVHLDVNLYEGRNLATIAEADTVAYYGAGIIEDYDRYTAACVVLETAERLAGAEETTLFDAVTDALERMQETKHPTLVLDQFVLQSMRAAGWAPQLFDCAQCGRPGPHHAFHPAVGGATCHECRPSGSAEVDEESLHLMWLLAQGRDEQARAIAEATPYLEHEGHRLTMAHLQWHMGTKITSVKVMDQR